MNLEKLKKLSDPRFQNIDPAFCYIHQDRPSTVNMSEDKVRPVMVCKECFTRFTKLTPICKHCKVRVVSRKDTRAKDPFKNGHAYVCPRYAGRERH